MFFVTRIHIPLITDTAYEAAINAKILNNAKLNVECAHSLLELQKHASNMAESFHQLKGITARQTDIELLESRIRTAIRDKINDNQTDLSGDLISINDAFNSLKVTLENEKCLMRVGNSVFLLTNSILASCAVLTLIFSAGLIATGPIGMIFLGIGLAAVSAVVLMATAYSLYVDSRALFGLQLEEIEEGINFLGQYPELIKEPQVAPVLVRA